MKCNVGGFDLAARAVLGSLLIAYAFFNDQMWAYLGIIPLLTAIFRFCPLYTFFNFSTKCKKNTEQCTQ